MITKWLPLILCIAITAEAPPSQGATPALTNNYLHSRIPFGPEGSEYVVGSERDASGISKVTFTKDSDAKTTKSFRVSGTLVGFQVTGSTLALTFDPVRTLVFAVTNGHPEIVVDCASRFGALIIEDKIVCLTGAVMATDTHEIKPKHATIYTYNRTAKKYESSTKIEYSELYLKLAQLTKEKSSSRTVDLPD
jgi:hypothetical protein